MLHGKLVFFGGTATAGVTPVLGSSGLGGAAPHPPLKNKVIAPPRCNNLFLSYIKLFTNKTYPLFNGCLL